MRSLKLTRKPLFFIALLMFTSPTMADVEDIAIGDSVETLQVS